MTSGDLQHCGDPVADWCASNVTVRTYPAGHQKPDKERSIERIDPIVAVIMAVGRSMAEQAGFMATGAGCSLLEGRGFDHADKRRPVP